MERDWLARRLEEGRSIESIAREVGRDPSTVAYWVNRHDLASQHAAKHRAKGGIPRERLEALVQQGRSVRQIAAELDRSATAVRHWLAAYELRTRPAHYAVRGEPKPPSVVRECAVHGWSTFVRSGKHGHYRCRRCNARAVAGRRRRVKEILVAEAGGACRLCGYARYAGALQFHHVDPGEKTFALSSRGLARSLEKARREVRKCVLLCATCHAEVEAGLATIPPTSGLVRHPLDAPVGGNSMAECSAVNRVVVGSSPTPRASAESPAIGAARGRAPLGRRHPRPHRGVIPP